VRGDPSVFLKVDHASSRMTAPTTCLLLFPQSHEHHRQSPFRFPHCLAVKKHSIEQLLTDWGKAETQDQTVTVRNILLTIEPKGNFSWFGFKDETGFPDEGFFVDEAFSVRVVPS
jgi:hypothetical protein